MKTLRTVAEVRAHTAAARADGRSIGLVPTMGALHAGHAALIRAARRECDEVVVSLFVNPTQFNEAADLAAYPRDEAADAALTAELGADVLFAPPVEEVYPAGFATTVTVAGLTDVLEGAHRGPGHFAGVCTVVCKLLTMVGPDSAYFGAKDAQQLVVVRRMVRDLDLPVAIVAVDTVREPDGLALSSRNVRLSAADRARALGLSRAMAAAERAVAIGQRDAAAVRAAALTELDGLVPEYLELVHPDSLAPLERLDGRVLVVVAARVGDVRLIDTTTIEVPE
jgi:pantoate--beta-alanine ligase